MCSRRNQQGNKVTFRAREACPRPQNIKFQELRGPGIQGRHKGREMGEADWVDPRLQDQVSRARCSYSVETGNGVRCSTQKVTGKFVAGGPEVI